MKKLYFVFSLLIIANFCAAQTPVFEWAKSIGGPNRDMSHNSAIDHYGNIYICGTFKDSIDIDPGAGTLYLKNHIGSNEYEGDVFVCKLDIDGKLIWAKSFGGKWNEEWSFMDIDSAGNVYLTGVTSVGTDLDPGPGTFYTTHEGLYVTHLDPDGNFVWAKSIKGVSSASCIKIDKKNNIYISGSFIGRTDFNPGADSFHLNSSYVTSTYILTMFLLKLDKNGDFIWAKSFNQNSLTHPFSGFAYININNKEEPYFATTFYNQIDIDPGPEVYLLNTNDINKEDSEAPSDVFVCKLNQSGDFIWAKQFVGDGHDYLDDFKMDDNGNLYLCGRFIKKIDIDPNKDSLILNSYGKYYSGYIVKLNRDGDLLWGHSLNNNEINAGSTVVSIAFDKEDGLYIAGSSSSNCDFDPTAATYNLYANSEGYICRLKQDGTFNWVIRDYLHINTFTRMFVNSRYDIITVHRFMDTYDYDPGLLVYNMSSRGMDDVSIRKLRQPSLVAYHQKLLNSDINIYPNPGNGIFSFEIAANKPCDNVVVENLMGQKLLEFQTKTTGIQQLDISNLSAGVYLVSFFEKGKLLKSQKLVKY